MAAPSYLTLAEFRLLTIIPAVDIDNVEADTPGFVVARLAANSSKINARLRKRYAVPFVKDPVRELEYPEIVLDWLVKLTQVDVYLKRGFDPADQSIAHVKADKDLAEADLLEAANSETGLFDLPLNNSKDPSAITKAGPMAYTETSPYVWTTSQRRDGAEEDRNG